MKAKRKGQPGQTLPNTTLLAESMAVSEFHYILEEITFLPVIPGLDTETQRSLLEEKSLPVSAADDSMASPSLS